MLLEQVEQFENIVGFFWVIEWTADHGFMRMRFSGSIVRGLKNISLCGADYGMLAVYYA